MVCVINNNDCVYTYTCICIISIIWRIKVVTYHKTCRLLILHNLNNFHLDTLQVRKQLIPHAIKGGNPHTLEDKLQKVSSYVQCRNLKLHLGTIILSRKSDSFRGGEQRYISTFNVYSVFHFSRNWKSVTFIFHTLFRI